MANKKTINNQSSRWLVISYYANVDASAMSHWVDDRLGELEKKGIACFVLSSTYGPQFHDRFHVRVPSIAPYTFQYELEFILRRRKASKFWYGFIKSSIFILLWPFYFLQENLIGLGGTHLSWSFLAIAVGLFVCLFKKPDLIYATGGPTSAQLSAMVLSRLTGISFIAEFQDPLVTPFAGRNSFFKRGLVYFEEQIHRNATRVIYCTQNARDSAMNRCNSGKAEAIYGGAPQSMAPGKLYNRGPVCRFAYFGTLYGSRNLNNFLSALEMILIARSDLAKLIKVELYGAVVGEARDRIEGFSKEVISLNPFVSRSTALSIAATADVLLLVQHIAELSSETIPSKVYDYFLTQRPVLGLVYQNDELKSMLERNGHLVAAADNVMAIKDAISIYLDKWNRDDLVNDHFPVTAYTTEIAVKKLLELVNPVPEAQTGS
jgi:hypothetical protein